MNTIIEQNVEIHPIEKQLILYTKGHFKRIDYQNDLKFFAAELYGMYPEQVQKYSINHMVVQLYEKLVNAEYIPFTLQRFLENSFKRAWHDGKSEIDYDVVLNQILAEIQNTAVKGMNLGKADLSLLESKYNISFI
ncbi:hypothetical protein V1503_19300 [Bacillus sp. SCS-151]|uniref:hypothetical protein n=1 Tax=Nanhaiella sioensis TaxID=3115293 RepID=UPI00397D61F8